MTAVEQVHALWSAFASGGPLATLDHVDEDCEWIPSPDFPGPHAAVRGPSAMRAYFEQLTAAGVRVEPTVRTYEAVGDDVVVVAGRIRIVSPRMLADSPHFWLYRVRDGRVARVESYASQRDALAAARSR
jgi:ketosteroid isomerase-like protein